MIRKAQSNVSTYYHRYTVPAEDKNKKDEQKRLQDTFHSNRVHLRFDNLVKQWQVWDRSPNDGLYCVMNVGRGLNMAKIIYLLRERQIGKYEFLQMLADVQQFNDRRMQDKIDALAYTMADGVRSHAVGKVTASLSDYPELK